MTPSSVNDAQSRAQHALAASPIHSLRYLRIDAEGVRLLISGRVPSFYCKQMAQELVLGMAGACEVVNRVEVLDGEGISSIPWHDA